MRNSKPLISVIIPCYNYAHYLADAINSVLKQTGDDFSSEIIVVDDGSTDNSAEIAQAFGPTVRYIYQENQGPSQARNTGIKNASGDFFIFLDADDLLGPAVISTHLKTFKDDPDLDLSVCHCYCINRDNDIALFWALKAANLDLHLCYNNIAPVHTFMLRREMIQDIGFFNTELRACEDYEYWLRCARLGKQFGTNPHSFVVYRQHGNSLSERHYHMLMHGISVRMDINNYFKNLPPFPKAGSYYGNLAYAAGLLASSIELLENNRDLALELVNKSAQALLEGAKSFPKSGPNDAQLLMAERYYALNFFIKAAAIGPASTPGLKRASSFIQARYSNIVHAPLEQLQAKLKNMRRALACNFDSVQDQVKNYKLPGELA